MIKLMRKKCENFYEQTKFLAKRIHNGNFSHEPINRRNKIEKTGEKL